MKTGIPFFKITPNFAAFEEEHLIVKFSEIGSGLSTDKRREGFRDSQDFRNRLTVSVSQAKTVSRIIPNNLGFFVVDSLMLERIERENLAGFDWLPLPALEGVADDLYLMNITRSIRGLDYEKSDLRISENSEGRRFVSTIFEAVVGLPDGKGDIDRYIFRLHDDPYYICAGGKATNALVNLGIGLASDFGIFMPN